MLKIGIIYGFVYGFVYGANNEMIRLFMGLFIAFLVFAFSYTPPRMVVKNGNNRDFARKVGGVFDRYKEGIWQIGGIRKF